MANTIKTNSLATLVAIRAAESAGYLTVGSKANFKDQLIGKRNGQTYRFVIRDTGKAENRLDIQSGDDVELTEREVALTLEPWHVAVKTNAIEGVTDLDMDKEVGEPNGQKLINAVVRKTVEKDLGKAGTAFVGYGFAPLSQASAHLASITNEDLYGFCDPNVEAILTSNGQMFIPTNAPDLYAKGLLGKFHGAEYRAQRFLPSVVISSVVSAALNGATVSSFSQANGAASIALAFGATSAASTIKKGTPIWIDGVMATDTVGDSTAQEKVWIALEDVSLASGATSATIKAVGVEMANNGTREVCDADESAMTDSKFTNRVVSAPEAGKYYMGIVRANGAMEFETLDKLDAAGSDYDKDSVEGVTVHVNKLVDLKGMENITRFDCVSLAGIVEPRCVSAFYVK